MSQKIMSLLLVVTLLGILFVSGCTSEKKSIYVEGYYDESFRLLIIQQSKDISAKMDRAVSLLNLQSWESLKSQYDNLKTDVINYKGQVDAIKLSLPWEYIRIDYDAYLNDMNWYAYYGSMGAFWMTVNDYTDGQNYFAESSHQLTNAMSHFDDCLAKIKSLQS